MSTSNQTYKELSIPYFKESFDCIDEVMQEFQIPYYLIGVSAIALVLLKEGIKPGRGTKDIDFAVMISSIKVYDKISDALSERGFKKVAAPWTFYSEQFKVAIDLLPFGEIEEKYTDNFSERYTDLHLLGFSEVMEEVVQVEIEEKIANIPPSPGMVILKLIAKNLLPRRTYFREELRKKLPELKKMEGLPIGEDDDILNLSDPPYYTACPNPFIAEWEAENKKLDLNQELQIMNQKLQIFIFQIKMK